MKLDIEPLDPDLVRPLIAPQPACRIRPQGLSIQLTQRLSPLRSWRRGPVAGAVLAALGLLGLAVVADGATPTTVASTSSAPAMTVTLARVASANWDSSLSASGSIEPWQEAVISAQTTGLRMLEVRVEVGDRVRRGQLLARFDAATLRASLAELQATLQRSEAEARQAATNRDRMQRLKNSGGVSEQELLQYSTEADTSAAQVAVVRAQLETRRLQLAHAEVRAPDDGVISALAATVGAVADNGQELFRLIRQGRLEWRGELTAAQLSSAAIGQRVALQLPDGSRTSGRVRQIAPRLDTQSRLALVYADLEAGGGARAGMYASGQLLLRQQMALVVPAASVVIRDGRSYVFKVATKEAAVPMVSAQAVQVGRRQGSAVEILGQLVLGEQVVVQGAGFLKDGDRVRVVPAEAPSAGHSPAASAARPAKGA